MGSPLITRLIPRPAVQMSTAPYTTDFTMLSIPFCRSTRRSPQRRQSYADAVELDRLICSDRHLVRWAQKTSENQQMFSDELPSASRYETRAQNSRSEERR